MEAADEKSNAMVKELSEEAAASSRMSAVARADAKVEALNKEIGELDHERGRIQTEVEERRERECGRLKLNSVRFEAEDLGKIGNMMEARGLTRKEIEEVHDAEMVTLPPPSANGSTANSSAPKSMPMLRDERRATRAIN